MRGPRFTTHNCDEQVVLLSGAGEVEVDGVVTPLRQYDGAYIEADKVHRYRNTSDTEPMVILWVYSSKVVTRTFADTGRDGRAPHAGGPDGQRRELGRLMDLVRVAERAELLAGERRVIEHGEHEILVLALERLHLRGRQHLHARRGLARRRHPPPGHL